MEVGGGEAFSYERGTLVIVRVGGGRAGFVPDGALISRVCDCR